MLERVREFIDNFETDIVTQELCTLFLHTVLVEEIYHPDVATTVLKIEKLKFIENYYDLAIYYTFIGLEGRGEKSILYAQKAVQAEQMDLFEFGNINAQLGNYNIAYGIYRSESKKYISYDLLYNLTMVCHKAHMQAEAIVYANKLDAWARENMEHDKLREVQQLIIQVNI